MCKIFDDFDAWKTQHLAIFSALQDGTKVAETSLKVTSPFRLGLVRPQEELHPTTSTFWWTNIAIENGHL